MAAEPGFCPNCDLPLMHTTEFRALSESDLEAEMRRQLLLEEERRALPLT
jgi:hypothetical protein